MKFKAFIVISATVAIFAASSFASLSEEVRQQQGSKTDGDLAIEITGIKSDSGEVRIGVARDKRSFDDEAFSFTAAEKPKDLKANHVFKGLPYGKYAIKVFHDENSNGKLDKNFLGVPRERYGASNNARSSFGPPEFDKAAFTFDKSMTVTIKVE